MEKRFDPMTGQPIEQKEQQPQMRFDPMTGQPVQQAQPVQPQPIPQPVQPVQQAPQQPQMAFDPMTGQQIQQAPQQPQMAFDPMTGQPVQQAPQQPQMAFDPMTGQPVQSQAAPVKKKKKKAPFIIGGIVAAVLVVVVTIAVLAKSGIFLSPNDKIILATYNTFEDKTELTKAVDVSDILNSGKYTVAVNGGYGTNTIDCSYLVEKKSQQLKGNVAIGSYPNIDFDIFLADGKVDAYTSLVSNYLFEYDSKKTNTGYLMQSMPQSEIDEFNYSLQQLGNSGNLKDTDAGKLTEALLEDFRALKFEKVDAKEITIDDKSRLCAGYVTYIDTNTMKKFVDDMKNNTYKGADVDYDFDELYEAIDDMSDIYLTVYIYKNKLASINVKSNKYSNDAELIFHGGKARWQNLEILADGKSVCQLVGSNNGSEESYEVKSDGYTACSLTYDNKTGNIAFSADEVAMTGTIKKSKNEFSFTLDNLYGINGTVTISKGAKVVKPMAENTFDLGNASEDDIQNMAMDAVSSNPELSQFIGGMY